jgi:ATP-dependent Lon protease
MSGYKKEINDIVNSNFFPVTEQLIRRSKEFRNEDNDDDEDEDIAYNEPYRDAEEMRLLNLLNDSTMTLKQRILTSAHPDLLKAKCLQMLREYEDDSENNSTAISALHLILKLPTMYKALPVTLDNEYDDIMKFLQTAWLHMQSCVYGQERAKSEIIEYLVSKLLTPNKYVPRVLGLVGPPGVGKTSLAIHGIADIMGVPFYQISIGGLRDVTYFSGTMRCWKGAHQGKFTDILIKEGYTNPIVYIDELDKVSAETAQDIYGWLTHATDVNTNKHIQDHYLGIDLDLSKVTFIFSYNDPSMIPAPLRDRIKEINFDGFGPEQKQDVVRDFIIPSCLKEFGLNSLDVKFSDDVIAYTNSLLQTNSCSSSVSGVRYLTKGYQSLIGKIMVNVVCNKSSLDKLKTCNSKQTSKAGKNTKVKKTHQFKFMPYYRSVELPCTVTTSDIDYYLT